MHRNLALLIYTCLCCVSIQSCETIIIDCGTVKEQETNLPVDSALVRLNVNDYTQDSSWTDKSGSYSVSALVGCVPKCPDYKIEVLKGGFDKKSLIFEFPKPEECSKTVNLKRNMTP